MSQSKQEIDLLVARGNNWIQDGGYIKFRGEPSQSSPQTGSRTVPMVTNWEAIYIYIYIYIYRSKYREKNRGTTDLSQIQTRENEWMRGQPVTKETDSGPTEWNNCCQGQKAWPITIETNLLLVARGNRTQRHGYQDNRTGPVARDPRLLSCQGNRG